MIELKRLEDYEAFKSTISKLEVDQKELKMENGRMSDRMDALERNFEVRLNFLSQSLTDVPQRLVKLESSTGSIGGSVAMEELLSKCKKLEAEMVSIRSSKASRFVTFQGLTIRSLREMKEWLEKDLPSMNYSTIIDVHGLFEHINFTKTMLQNSLNTLQKLCKLEIPTANHAVIITSFESKFPKFFNQRSDHKVAKAEDLLFDTIKT